MPALNNENNHMNGAHVYLIHYWPCLAWFAGVLCCVVSVAVLRCVVCLFNKDWNARNKGKTLILGIVAAVFPFMLICNRVTAASVLEPESTVLQAGIEPLDRITLSNTVCRFAEAMPDNLTPETAASRLFYAICNYLITQKAYCGGALPCILPSATQIHDGALKQFLYRDIYLHRKQTAFLDSLLTEDRCQQLNRHLRNYIAENQRLTHESNLQEIAYSKTLPVWALVWYGGFVFAVIFTAIREVAPVYPLK